MEAGYVIKLDIFEIRDYGFADCLDEECEREKGSLRHEQLKEWCCHLQKQERLKETRLKRDV